METKEISIKLIFSRRQIMFAMALLFLAWRPTPLGSETLTMTTYYPAPFGGYVSLLSTDATYLARDGGSVVIGTENPAPIAGAKLDVRGGSIELDHREAIHSRGDMYVGGEGVLYLESAQDVVVSAGNGGNGDLSVEGSLKVCHRRNFTGTSGTTSCDAGYKVTSVWYSGAPSGYTILLSRPQLLSAAPNPNDGHFGTAYHQGTILCCKISD